MVLQSDIKYVMRICEVIKTIKPLTAQQQQRAQERLRRAQAAVAKAVV